MKILLNFIPNYFLTFCMGQLANSKNKFIKNFFINTFIKIYKPDLSIAKKKKAKDYISYNNFFTRELKDNARPINLSENIICSPVDGSIIDFGLIFFLNLLDCLMCSSILLDRFLHLLISYTIINVESVGVRSSI